MNTDYEGDKNKVFSNAGTGDTFAEVMARRLSRRGVLKNAVASSAVVIAGDATAGGARAQSATPRGRQCAGRRHAAGTGRW